MGTSEHISPREAQDSPHPVHPRPARARDQLPGLCPPQADLQPQHRAPGTVQYSTVQYSTVQYSTVQYSTEQYSTEQYSNAITRPGVSRVSRLFTHAGDLSIINQVSCGCGCLCIVERSKKEGDTLVFKQNTEWFHRKLCNRVASCVSISIPPQLVCSGIRSAMGKKYVQCRKLTFYMIFTHPPGPPAVSISLQKSFF